MANTFFTGALKVLRFLLPGILLLGCSKKEKPPANLTEWLERNFPNRYEVVASHMSDPIRNMSFKVRKSVIADKADTLLQVQVTWDKRDPNLGLSAEDLASRFEAAKKTLANARSLSAALKSAGLAKYSAGIRNGDAVILLYLPPTPKNRKNVLQPLKKAISQWPAASAHGLGIYFMEPSTFRKEFAEIVPLSYWVSLDNRQARNTILSAHFRDPQLFDPKKGEGIWVLNTESDLLLRWTEQARPVAEKWANTQLKRKIHLLPTSEQEPLRKKLGVRLSFPYAYGPQETDKAAAYVVGEFLLDKNVFEPLKIERRSE
jgi:hypothetical protein